MILGLGPIELLILTALVVALFGLGRLPQIAREVGRFHGAIQRLKNELRGLFRFF